ncbi:MAG: ribose-phosphate pyrophosphokinase [Zetaproteobacteria bacterium]|nr:ribose-phosphate pyrophosphokinase [Zetaproteobacteria bacterium]
MNSRVIVFGGNANPELNAEICRHLNIEPGKISVGSFSDGETRVRIDENVRGADVYVLQPTCAPGNQHLMEALVMIDACRRASARKITLVAPYFGYARQERKDSPRAPITAKLVAQLMETAGIDRLLTLELHNSAIQGFFQCPVDHLFAKDVFARYFSGRLDHPVVVSPDAGGVERSRAFAKLLRSNLAIIDKRRPMANESAVMHIIGEVKGKDCLILDDIVDTAGSLTNAASALLAEGAKSVRAAITHPVLSGPAIERIRNSRLEELVVTNSIPLSHDAKNLRQIRQVSIAHLIAEAVQRIHDCTSVSSLFS